MEEIDLKMVAPCTANKFPQPLIYKLNAQFYAFDEFILTG